MPGDVRGRRVVITGASRGLGRVLSVAFARLGARIVAVARGGDDLRELIKEIPGDVVACAGDVSDPDFNEHVVDRSVEEFGGIDVWIANAGISPVVAGPLDLQPATWRRIVDVNLSGVFYGARAAARVLGAGGRIIVTASVLGQHPREGLSAYSASKAGVIALVKSLALDLGPYGITVNAVAPGWFDSPLAEGWKRNPKLGKQILNHTVQRRWGRSEDLPGAYLFLASEASAYITGTVIPVDGGYLCV